jgi:hypothetical protein
MTIATSLRADSCMQSAVVTLHDDPYARGTPSLRRFLRRVAASAENAPMQRLVDRMASTPYYPLFFPGEHYALLWAIVHELAFYSTKSPLKNVVEIGTFTGLSALAMRDGFQWAAGPACAGQVTTFDIVPWQKIHNTCLRDDDFTPSGGITQIVGDLSDDKFFYAHIEIIQQAGLIFCDGPKNVKFENEFWSKLNRVGLPKCPLIVFDDTRLMEMLAFWRNIKMPKLDATSFGHYTGTGLVQWQQPDSVGGVVNDEF